MATDPTRTDHPDTPRPTDSKPGKARTGLEIVIVLALGSTWFFWGTSTGDLLGMEPLRAVVVKEMLEADHGPVPTVHGRVYLRKLPLYAWTTTALARAAGGLDEQVARWPSAALGVLYLLTMYAAGRWLVHPRAGLPAAALAGGNWLVLKYGLRADLDMGVLSLTTLAIVLLGRAWQAQGRGRIAWLIGAYLAALAGSFWKAPHVQVMVWLTVAGLAWFDRRAGRTDWWRFAVHPAQIALSIVNATLMAAWYLALSDATGSSSRVGKFVLLEFLARVVPHSGSYLLELLGAPFMLALAAFPASLFVVLLVMKPARAWLDPGREPRHRFLLAWVVPGAIFLTLVQAKAPRYWFLILGGVTLLATMIWWRFRTGELPDRVRQVCSRVLRGTFVVVAVGALGAVLFGLLLWLEVLAPAGIPHPGAGAALIAAGVLGLLAGVLTALKADASRPGTFAAAFVAVAIAVKLGHVGAVLPIVSVMETLKPAAQKVDALVPPEAALFALSDKPGSDRAGELGDLGYYCQRFIVWPLDLDDALARRDGRPLYLLVRDRGRERLEERFGDGAVLLETIAWRDKDIYLYHIPEAVREAPATAPSSRPTTQPR